LKGIKLDEIPPILGFNETKLHRGCTSIFDIHYMSKWYPLLAARYFGKGKASVFTSSASPHWRINLVKWKK